MPVERITYYTGKSWRYRYENLCGKKHGLLTPILYVQNPIGSRYLHQWLCKCDCGNWTKVDTSALRTGHVKSCGCWMRAIQANLGRQGYKKINPSWAFTRDLMSSYKTRCKKMGFVWQLNEKEFKDIVIKPCFYCGDVPTKTNKNKRHPGDYAHHGLDRVDNNRGYDKDNIVPCCTMCNRIKLTHTLDAFVDRLVKIYNNLGLSYYNKKTA